MLGKDDLTRILTNSVFLSRIIKGVVHCDGNCDTTMQFNLLVARFALILLGRPRPTRFSIIPWDLLSFPELLGVRERCWISLESDRSCIHLPTVSSEAENSLSSIIGNRWGGKRGTSRMSKALLVACVTLGQM